uniref:SXP/RAL-2 family protein Ani s 5-like cation-binding domain-containing protein n=1 Tax=Panagrellus redivivus TaxID=6233 RepID=A0A7E4VHD7_PANRE
MRLLLCLAVIGIACVCATDTDVTSPSPTKVGAVATLKGGAGATMPLAAYIRTVKSGFEIKKLIDQFDINKITDKFNKFKTFLEQFKKDVDKLKSVKKVSIEALLEKAKKFIPVTIPVEIPITFTPPPLDEVFTTPEDFTLPPFTICGFWGCD